MKPGTVKFHSRNGAEDLWWLSYSQDSVKGFFCQFYNLLFH